MSDFAVTLKDIPKRFGRVPGWIWVIALSGVIFALISQSLLSNYPENSIRFRIDLSRFLIVPLAVQIHIVSALTAFFVGLWILVIPKGRGMHKPLGWTWVAAMAVTAISSFWITGINGKSFSWIHGLSAWTMMGLPYGIYAIRNKDVKKHAKNMTGMFLGAMIVAGLFTFLPGRFMWSLFFTS